MIILFICWFTSVSYVSTDRVIISRNQSILEIKEASSRYKFNEYLDSAQHILAQVHNLLYKVWYKMNNFRTPNEVRTYYQQNTTPSLFLNQRPLGNNTNTIKRTCTCYCRYGNETFAFDHIWMFLRMRAKLLINNTSSCLFLQPPSFYANAISTVLCSAWM